MTEPMFLTTIGEETPVILCERHAQTFEFMMSVCEMPHTIYEMEDEDAAQARCQACNLPKDIEDNRPRIILN